MNELETRIAQLNSKAKTINAIRQQNIGRRETLLKQQAEAIDAYNKKYGKNITTDTVGQEYERVAKEKAEEVEHIERIISAIENGNLDEANTLAGVKPDVVQGVSSVLPDYSQQAEEKPAEKVHTEPTGTPFIPSPVANPINEDTGNVAGMPVGGSIFNRDFSKPVDDDDDMGTPAPPPKIGSLF